MTFLALSLVAILAYAFSAAAVPLIVRVAERHRLLDFPDEERRGHSKAVPRLGGVAVFIGMASVLGLAAVVGRLGISSLGPLPTHPGALLAACAILFAIGLLDDLRGVPPVVKLLGQTLSALIVCEQGFAIPRVAFPPNFVIELHALQMPIAVLWLVGMSNAFNLVDGLDGLAGGVGVIVLAAVTAAAAVLGNPTVPFFCMALSGALLGFLKSNFTPARIFLGDSGSLVVGFLLALLAVKGATRLDGTVLAIVPIFALSYPLLDTGISMLRRWLRGHPLSRADGRHIHHQLRALGLSPQRAAAVIYIEVAAVAVLGLSVTFAPPAATVAIAAAGGAILLFIFAYGVRWLQYHEFLEAGTVVVSAGSRMRGAIRDTISARDIARLIAVAGTLDQVNAILEDAADIFRFAHMSVGRHMNHTPAHMLADTPLPRVWKVEYPIITEHGASVDDFDGDAMVLSIWSTMSVQPRAANVERVAAILAPAIANWSENAGAVLIRRTQPRRVYSPAFATRLVANKLPPELPSVTAHGRERLPIH
ncbi:MAG TPA: MraY family glycosyltransferase [Gemmatimonadaceae bacterium]|nr:MraY family glycosyltransferase [Gemmatimonadaceae bacterium]